MSTTPFYINDDDASFVAQALRLAAERYEQDALIVSDSKAGIIAGQNRLADQFVYQADKARAIAARFENPDNE